MRRPPLDRHPFAPPGFHPGLDAWILGRHADVTAALRNPRLVAPGEARVADTIPGGLRPGGGRVREAAGRALAPRPLAALREGPIGGARGRARALPADTPVDLVGAFAAPWSVAVALAVAGASTEDADRLTDRARTIFRAAARATGPDPSPEAAEATAALARLLSPPEPQRRSRIADPQAFVALAQTLPCLLAAAWEVLLRHPEAMARLRAEPALRPRGMEELLRLASPSKAVFREAVAPVEVGGARIGPGERVVLLLARANRDPTRFPDPDRLDLARDDGGRARPAAGATGAGARGAGPGEGTPGHVALGHGVHGCPGAALVRLCLTAATEALLEAWEEIVPAGPVPRLGGFAIDGPTALPVRLGGPLV